MIIMQIFVKTLTGKTITLEVKCLDLPDALELLTKNADLKMLKKRRKRNEEEKRRRKREERDRKKIERKREKKWEQ